MYVVFPTPVGMFLQERSVVVIDKNDTLAENSKIYYIKSRERYLIRRLEVDARRAVVALISDNAPSRYELPDGETVEIIGRCRLQQSEL